MELASEDYISIALAVVLLLLIIAIVVTLLVKNGFCEKDVHVSPKEDEEKDRPKLISNFARSENGLYYLTPTRTDTSTPRREFKPGPEANPIIYMYDGVYHPSAKREVTTTSNAGSAEKDIFDDRIICTDNHKPNRTSTKRQSMNRFSLPKKSSKIGRKNAQNAAIPDTGIDVYTIHGYNGMCERLDE